MENKKSLKKILKVLMSSFILFIYITVVLALSFGATTAGVLTIIPSEASKPNSLGYDSVCAFAPFSTFILIGISIIGFILFKRMVITFRTKHTGLKSSLELEYVSK